MKNMIQPDYLQKGDSILILAPAKRILPNELDEEIQMIKSWGLEIILSKNLYNSYNFGYAYSGTIEERLEDFQEALNHSTIKAIWCARGGYGSIQLIDQLDYSQFIQSPKWIIGYSDITVFHTKIYQLGIQSLHGMVVKKLKNTNYHSDSYESVKALLFNENFQYQIPINTLNKNGVAQGNLIGGNLSIIYSLLGSETALNGENTILFLEDWYENWYHLDRMLMSLKRAGILSKIKGLILGNFTFMDTEEENKENYTNSFDPVSYQIIASHIKDLNIPVSFGFPAGHTGHNLAMKFGAKVELSIQSNSVNLTYI